MAILKTTGSNAGRLNFHFYVAHPPSGNRALLVQRKSERDFQVYHRLENPP